MSETTNIFSEARLHLSPGQTQQYDTFRMFEEYIRRIYCARMKWNDLPEGIPPYIVEKQMFYAGVSVFFCPSQGRMLQSSNDKFVVAPEKQNVDPEKDFFAVLLPDRYGPLDFYWRPVNWYIPNGKQTVYHRSYRNSVLIRDNSDLAPPFACLYNYIDLMAKTFVALKQNITLQNVPFMIYTSKDAELVAKNKLQQLMDMSPYMIQDKKTYAGLGAAPEATVLDLHVDLKSAELMQAIREAENRCLTWLGIDNLAIEKKERVNAIEVSTNNEVIKRNLQDALDIRQEACDRINFMFGLNVSVEIRDTAEIMDVIATPFGNSDPEASKEGK